MPDTSHECPAPGCYTAVPRTKLACPKHWARVHPDTKREVNAAYRAGNLTRHAAAMADAIADMTPRPKGATR
jgi:hypothetical protein